DIFRFTTKGLIDCFDKGQDIMSGNLLNLLNPVYIQPDIFLNLFKITFRDFSQFRPGPAGRQLNIQPDPVFVLFTPDLDHLWQTITFDQSNLLISIPCYSSIP